VSFEIGRIEERMKWYIDFEGYQCLTNYYVVKEIALLREDGQQCYVSYVKSPLNYCFDVNNPTMQFQYNRHKLKWEEGDHTFDHVMRFISQKVKNEFVFVKGIDKQRFLERYLPHVVDLEMLPSFKYLNSCPAECCDKYHGKYCARRKVHELKYYIDNYKVHDESLSGEL
jgi:hypothetical protein